jgi:hypothetical protein
MKYFIYLGSMITNDARCAPEIKSRISMGTEQSKEEDAYQQQVK